MEGFKKEFPVESTEGDKHTSIHNQYEFDVYKLIHLTQEIPISDVSVEEYQDELDDPRWRDNKDNRITPREVVEIYKREGLENAIAAHPELSQHLRKLEHADCSHPILIFESKILDGSHRFAKACSNGQITIKAKIITSIPQASIIKIRDRE